MVIFHSYVKLPEGTHNYWKPLLLEGEAPRRWAMLGLRLRFLPDHRVAGSTEGADGTAQISGYLGDILWPKISLISQIWI